MWVRVGKPAARATARTDPHALRKSFWAITAGMARAKKPVDTDALLQRVDELVQRHGAVPRSQLSSLRRHLPAIASQLHARGYEVGSTIRRPLEEQLLQLVDQGFVSNKGLEKRLAGATAKEAKEAAQRLTARGALVVVMREAGIGFVLRSSDDRVAQDLDELLRCLTNAQRLVRRARGKRGGCGVLRDDIARQLSRWTNGAEQASASRSDADGLEETLDQEIRRRLRADGHPIHVPDLLRSVGASAEAGKRALLAAAARGVIALEPESGMGRLSREDAEWCPVGPMGTRLSWVVARGAKGVN